jgi:hypothetical protein
VGKSVDSVDNIARTLDQRLESLKRANDIRFVRATLKRNLKDGSANPYPILDEPAPEFATMKIETFLLALPGWGPTRVHAAMLFCRIADAKTLGGLSLRQRGEIQAYLRKKGV